MSHKFISNKIWQPRRGPLGSNEHLIDAILDSRGISPHLRGTWLEPSLAHLQSPSSMKGVALATGRLWQAFQNQEVVGIYTDFDLDGSCAVTLLYEGLSALGFKNLILEQPSRLEDGYGFHEKNVVSLKEKGVSLILTADVGITGLAACERASELGLDVIITDHHQPKLQLPKAFAIINPNQRDCPSDLGYLCGAAVGFYLLRALARKWSEEKQSFAESFLNGLLDVVALATVADMVPLVGDNRVLVKKGLKSLQQTRRPALRYLLKDLQLEGKDLNTKDVGIKLAPKLNALSRLELSFRPAELLLVKDLSSAQLMVEQAFSVNGERLRLQKEAEALALEMIESFPDLKESWACVVGHDSFHPGVVGLVASTLTRKLSKPSFVAYKTKEGTWKGSARNPEGFPLSLLTALEHLPAGILKAFGGHMAACGFELLDEGMLPKLRECLDSYYRRELTKSFGLELTCYYDFELPMEYWGRESLQVIESLEPYGPGFEAPRFLFKNVLLQQGSRLNQGGLKAQVFGQGERLLGETFEVISFQHPSRVEDVWLHAAQSGKGLDLIGRFQRNHFRGQERLQLVVEDLRTRF